MQYNIPTDSSVTMPMRAYAASGFGDRADAGVMISIQSSLYNSHRLSRIERKSIAPVVELRITLPPLRIGPGLEASIANDKLDIGVRNEKAPCLAGYHIK